METELQFVVHTPRRQSFISLMLPPGVWYARCISVPDPYQCILFVNTHPFNRISKESKVAKYCVGSGHLERAWTGSEPQCIVGHTEIAKMAAKRDKVSKENKVKFELNLFDFHFSDKNYMILCSKRYLTGSLSRESRCK